jgi:dihydrofolate reductase
MKAIVAMDIHRGIGLKGKIPWHLADDMRFFKQKTLETKKLVMGKDTFQSVGTLKDRFTYVLTSDLTLQAIPPFTSYRYVGPDFFKTEPHNDVWLCGGPKTYTLLLPYCTEVFVTLVLDEYDVDSYFPPHEHLFPNCQIITEARDYWILKYWK